MIKHAMQMVDNTEGGDIKDADVRGMVEDMLEANSWSMYLHNSHLSWSFSWIVVVGLWVRWGK